MLVDTNLVGLGPYLVQNQVNRSGTMPKMIYHVTSSMSATCHGQRGRDSDLPHQFWTNEVIRDHVSPRPTWSRVTSSIQNWWCNSNYIIPVQISSPLIISSLSQTLISISNPDLFIPSSYILSILFFSHSSCSSNRL